MAQWKAAPAAWGPAIAGTTVLSIGLGLIAEYTVFAAPVADVVDIVHQSLGAVVVGIACILVPGGHMSRPASMLGEVLLAGLGLTLTVIGAALVGII